jgi:hypothetical protein
MFASTQPRGRWAGRTGARRKPRVARDTVPSVGSQSKRLRALKKRDEQGNWVPGKISELIWEFARPLRDEAGEPRNIDDLRNVLTLATLCWNLPLFERDGVPELADMQASFQGTLGSVPEAVAGLLRRLVEERKTRFAEIPFYIVAEIRGTTLDDCSVHAEARQARGASRSTRSTP